MVSSAATFTVFFLAFYSLPFSALSLYPCLCGNGEVLFCCTISSGDVIRIKIRKMVSRVSYGVCTQTLHVHTQG